MPFRQSRFSQVSMNKCKRPIRLGYPRTSKIEWDCDGSLRAACLEALARHRMSVKGAGRMQSYRRSNTPLFRKGICRYVHLKTGSSGKNKPLFCYLMFLSSKFVLVKGRNNPLRSGCEKHENVAYPYQFDATARCLPGVLEAEKNVASVTSSMSKRRIASNIPVLRRSVEMPPALEFSRTVFERVASWNDFASEHEQNATELPATPLDQIIHTPENPPRPWQSRMLTCKPKLSLFTTIRAAPVLQQTVNACHENDLSWFPFTPLESPQTSLSSPDAELVSQLSRPEVCVLASPASPTSFMTARTTSQRVSTNKEPSRFPFPLPRRLSYKTTLPSTSSPLTPNLAFSLLQPTEGDDLASPVSIPTSMPTILQPTTPCQARSPVSFPKSRF